MHFESASIKGSMNHSNTFKGESMSEKIETMKAFAQVGFGRLDRATKDLTEEQLDWKSCVEANTIRWCLTHLASEMFVFVPKIIKGDKEYKPEGWPDDYVGNESYSLEKIMGDIEKGKAKFMKTLDNLTEETLVEEMDWFYGKRPKEAYMMLAISEILHHEGQIAAILGVEKRMQGT
jgi:uncharacterized damage-inducible protein DinB